MTPKRQREIVIEYERIQLIRKRAKTSIRTCQGCKGETDVVRLSVAAELFEISEDELKHFIDQNAVHFEPNDETVCVVSMLNILHKKQNMKRIVGLNGGYVPDSN